MTLHKNLIFEKCRPAVLGNAPGARIAQRQQNQPWTSWKFFVEFSQRRETQA